MKQIVKRIVVIGTDGEARTIFEKPGSRRKKGSAGLREIEKMLRKRAQADQAAMSTYLARHQRSNEKRRDGWLRDLPVNAARANEKGAKILRDR
jgi:Family of unknown function (DUF6312)